MTTGEDGRFSIRIPGDGTYDLVAHHIDYETSSVTLQATALTDTVFNFSLRPKSMSISEVVVREKRRIGMGLRNLFWMRFFGVTELKNKVIQAENTDDVHYSFNADTRILKASAEKPIQVVNHLLGYRIYYTLSEFSYDCKALITILRGYPRFEALEPESEAQAETWRTNRLAAYHGSMMHFTRSLYDGKAPKEGFIVQGIVRQDTPSSDPDWRENKRIRDAVVLLTKPLPLRQLVKENPQAPEQAKTLETSNSLMVSELLKKNEGKRKERTDTTTLFTLHFRNNNIFFYPDGSYYPPADIVKESYDRYGILYLLPWDYTPGD